MRFFIKQPRRHIISVDRPSKVWRLSIIGIVALLFGVVSWVGLSSVLALRNVTVGNDADAPLFFRFGANPDPESIDSDGDGRINILVIGADKAAGLTDTLQIFSIDPINDRYTITSIPRDLVVTTPGLGRTKINAVYNGGERICRAKNSCDRNLDAGGVALKDLVEEITGQQIHYFIRTNFAGLRQVVDALGGIEINVERPLRDLEYPAETGSGYSPFFVAAGLQRMNGETALRYARSRNTTDDFDRARRQQQVLSAIRDKALSARTLTDPIRLTDLVSALGQNMRTDIQTAEMARLASLVARAQPAKDANIVLNTTNSSPLRLASDNLGSVILPKLGERNFRDLQRFIAPAFQEPHVAKEAADVTIVNASNRPEAIKNIEEFLRSLGYKVRIDPIAARTQNATTVTASNRWPITANLLENRFSASRINQQPPNTGILLTIGTEQARLWE